MRGALGGTFNIRAYHVSHSLVPMPQAYAYCITPVNRVEREMAKKIDLKRIRSRHGLSQVEMAERLGVDQATISKIEAGKLDPNRTLAILLTYVVESGFVEI